MTGTHLWPNLATIAALWAGGIGLGWAWPRLAAAVLKAWGRPWP